MMLINTYIYVQYMYIRNLLFKFVYTYVFPASDNFYIKFVWVENNVVEYIENSVWLAYPCGPRRNKKFTVLSALLTVQQLGK